MINFKKITVFYKKNKLIINLGAILLFVLMEIWRTCFQGVITFFDDLSIFIAFGTFVFTLINWGNNRKQNEEITLELFYDEQVKQLDVTIKRRHLTRSEVAGMLGALYRANTGKSDGYNIPFLAKKAFYTRLEDAQSGETSTLRIDIGDQQTFDNFTASTPLDTTL